MMTDRRSDGTFTSGPKRLGRPPGARNKVPRDLRNLVLDTAERHGQDGTGKNGLPGYFDRLADERPEVFAGYIAKLLPRSIDADVAVDGGTVELTIVTIPQGFYFLPSSYEADPWLYAQHEVDAMTAIRQAARERAEALKRKVMPGGDEAT